MPKTHLERILQRNTHRRWADECFKNLPGSGYLAAKDDADNFLTWIRAKLLSGESVHLHRLGTLKGVFRPAWTHPKHPKTGKPLKIPAMICVKFKPSPEFRKALIALAIDEKKAKKLFKHHANIDEDIRKFREEFLRRPDIDHRAVKDEAEEDWSEDQEAPGEVGDGG